MGAEFEYANRPTHFANGLLTTSPLTVGGPLAVTSKLTAAEMSIGTKLGGTVTVTSGTAIATVSLTTINSNSLIMLQATTDVASDQIVNFNPTSRVEGSSFGVAASAIVTRNVIVNYLIFEV